MTTRKHYHSSILVENASIWENIKSITNFFSEGPIKVTHCKKKKHQALKLTHIWMYPQLINMDYK
jgi:hypothetical protein